MIFKAEANGELTLGERRVRCAFGPSGVVPASDKREGDGATPLGIWPLHEVLYRPDRGPPPTTGLPVRALSPDDGWCDAPVDPAYNRAVRLPYPASAETLWRDDHIYDIIVILGHNDDPVRPGMGSAIFLHISRPDYSPTQGCVAIARDDLEDLLALARPGDAVEIAAA